ncbi:hypothetical protein FAI40_01815 [Acetobacteraceae bacterium]|nr:hypothetical protein FAI40_01815 [Acetobacteraceae bacterium]
MMSFPFPPAIMDISQAAFYLGNISTVTFNKKVAPHLRKINIAGRRVGFLKKDLDAFIMHAAGVDLSEKQENVNPLDAL